MGRRSEPHHRIGEALVGLPALDPPYDDSTTRHGGEYRSPFRSRRGKIAVFGAGDNLVLQLGRQVAKIIAVAGHAHDQVAIGVGRAWALRSVAASTTLNCT